MAKAEQAHAMRTPKSLAKRMSDNVAIALVIYTMMLIFVTSPRMHFGDMSIIPYFMLVVFVGCAIPFCKKLENKWAAIEHAGTDTTDLTGSFNFDRIKLWVATFLVPILLAAVAVALSGGD